ncbi:MAG: methyltransferase [Thermotogae bacterium]|nr:methyltransferase [Thermotogota bacterium]
MTSRERVITSLKHKEPDRVPVDFDGMRSTGIHARAYSELKRHLNLNDKSVRIYDLGQQLGEVDEETRQIFNVDVVALKGLYTNFGCRLDRWKKFPMFPDGEYYVPEDFNPQKDEEDNWIVKDETGKVIAKMPKGGYYFDGIYYPLENAQTKEDIDKFFASLKPLDDEEVNYLIENAKYFRENTNYAIMGNFGGNFFEAGHGAFGYQKFMELLAFDRSLVEHFLGRLEEYYLKNLEIFLENVGDYIDIIQFGDDFGSQNGPQISLKMFRELFKPHLKRLCEYTKKKNKNIFTFLHSCGSISALLPDIIDAGVDIINPVQTSAANMDPEFLKKEFGDSITFWGGGADTQKILPFGSKEEVIEDVKRRIDIFAPGGGFVFTAVHNIQYGVPAQNVVTMFETVKNHGKYDWH